MEKYLVSELWYRTSSFQDAPIVELAVERHTEHSVWIKGRKHSRGGQYENFFPTWKEAHDYLLDRAMAALQSARLALQRAEGHLGNIKGLKHSSAQPEPK